MGAAADRPLVIGTAGHIDHGKTALVKALTGRDTDRLAEERRRGISIELGYAPLTLPGGRRVSIVDVPGHERFVRTMVAGATGVELFVLCVAADDGVMQQSREHLAVLRALGVTEGVVAITKCDLADPAGAVAELEALVPGAAVVPVAAPAGRGLAELLAAIGEAADRAADRAVDTAAAETSSGTGAGARLHVDRAFTLNGIGTIATGTLRSGQIAAADAVRVLPHGSLARVRSVHVHDTPVECARAGQRVALNLTGPGRREVERGDVICGRDDELGPTYRLLAQLTVDPAGRGRLHVHHGTRDTAARATRLQDGRHRLTFERPLIAAAGDRFVLRTAAPPDTIGGGVVLDPHPRARPSAHGDRVATPASAEPPRGHRVPAPPPAVLERLAALLAADGARPRGHGALAAALGVGVADVRLAVRMLERQGRAVRVARDLDFDAGALDRLAATVLELCRRDGGATTIAAARDELGTSRRIAEAVLGHLDAARVTVRRGDLHVLRRSK